MLVPIHGRPGRDLIARTPLTSWAVSRVQGSPAAAYAARGRAVSEPARARQGTIAILRMGWTSLEVPGVRPQSFATTALARSASFAFSWASVNGFILRPLRIRMLKLELPFRTASRGLSEPKLW